MRQLEWWNLQEEVHRDQRGIKENERFDLRGLKIGNRINRKRLCSFNLEQEKEFLEEKNQLNKLINKKPNLLI